MSGHQHDNGESTLKNGSHGECDSLKIYLREISKFPLLTREQEFELATRIQQGDKEAKSLMIHSNLRLVVKIAYDYINFGVSIQDLISEGNLGLIRAIERFNPNLGAKLSTYAAWWIKQSIKRALANHAKTIRLPVHVMDKLSKIRRAELKLTEELEREPTDEEIGSELGMTGSRVAQLKEVSIRPTSLESPVLADGGEDASVFGELIADDEALNPAEVFHEKILRKDVRECVKHLEERERVIITARFGLNGKRAITLEAIGRRFHVTRERIRQLQNSALRHLKDMLEEKERHPFQSFHILWIVCLL